MFKIMRKDKFKYVVAGTVLFCFLLIVHALTYRSIPDVNKEIFVHTIGLVEGAVLTIVTYYFGSSSSSADKNEIISNLKSKNQTTL